jgi:anti-sigma B factor antagonist
LPAAKGQAAVEERKQDWPVRVDMEVSTTPFENVTAVAVKGRVDSTTADGLTSRLSELVKSGASRLVIDLKEVSYISSAGFRTLLITARAVGQASGKMVLCGISGEMQRLFDLSGFSELFTILPNRDDALAKLRTVDGA